MKLHVWDSHITSIILSFLVVSVHVLFEILFLFKTPARSGNDRSLQALRIF